MSGMLPALFRAGKGPRLRSRTVLCLAGAAPPIDNRHALAAWPIEELWLRPVLTALLVLLLPLANRRVLLRLLSPIPNQPDPTVLRPAYRAVSLLEAPLATLLGFSALAPALTDSVTVRWALAAVCTVLTLASGAMVTRSLPRTPASLKGRAGASAAAAGLLVGAAALLLCILAERLTRIAPSEIAATAPDAAWRRLRVDPSDGSAMLALGWASAEANDHELSRLRIEEAQRMGAPAAELAEARAQLAALQGDCDGAWRSFDEALSARAAESFSSAASSGELPELLLGGYHLPSAMIVRCPRRSPE